MIFLFTKTAQFNIKLARFFVKCLREHFWHTQRPNSRPNGCRRPWKSRFQGWTFPRMSGAVCSVSRKRLPPHTVFIFSMSLHSATVWPESLKVCKRLQTSLKKSPPRLGARSHLSWASAGDIWAGGQPKGVVRARARIRHQNH